MIFQILTKDEFSHFADHSRYGNFMQSVERRDLRKRMGFNTYLIGVKEKGNIVASGLLVERNQEAWIQNGPILDWTDAKLVKFFMEKLLDFCKKKCIVELEVYPPVLFSIRNFDGTAKESFGQEKLFEIFSKLGFKHTGFSEKMEFKALRWMFVKNLDGLNDMRAVELSFNASTRKKYHQTKRNLEIYTLKDKSELKDWIVPLQESNLKNHIKTRDLKYFEDLWDTFGKKASFVEARVADTKKIVSSELDIWHNNESVAFLAGTINNLKKYNGITAIKGWQLEECLKRKQKRANFYGIDGVFTSDNPLLKSKSGFGGFVEEYIGGFKIVLNPVRYYINSLTIKLKRKLGLEKK